MSDRRKILITGTVSSGKTTLLRQFQNRHGIYVIEETARDIMQKQIFNDAATIQQAIYEEQLHREDEAEIMTRVQGKSIILCDRGIIDIIAYSKLLGYQVPDSWKVTCKDRYDFAFVLSKDNFPYFPLNNEGFYISLEFRNQIDTEIRATISRFGVPSIGIHGSLEERIHLVESIIQPYLRSIEGGRKNPEYE